MRIVFLGGERQPQGTVHVARRIFKHSGEFLQQKHMGRQLHEQSAPYLIHVLVDHAHPPKVSHYCCVRLEVYVWRGAVCTNSTWTSLWYGYVEEDGRAVVAAD